LTPPSISNRTSLRITVVASSIADKEIVRLDRSPQPFAQLRRKTQCRAERAMVNGDPGNLTFGALREDGHARNGLVAKRLGFPFQVGALAALGFASKGERLVDFAGSTLDVSCATPAHDRTCENTPLENNILR
jgi:hypothetical protein